MQPTEQPRRSMIYRLLLNHGAEFEACGDSSVAMRYPGDISETDQAATMGIADLSPLPRIGMPNEDTPLGKCVRGILYSC